MLNVLIFEEQYEYAKLVEQVVTSLGHLAIVSNTSLDFTEALLDEIDICFLSVYMPYSKSFEILQNLAIENGTAEIVLAAGNSSFILKTARDFAEERGLEVLAMLDKPFDREMLENLLVERSPKIRLHAARKRHEPRLADLELAIEKNQLFCVYQPQVDLADNTCVGVEALVRWNRPGYGIVSPLAFIPAAEKHGLICDITHFVVERACEEIAPLLDQNADLRLSVNISPSSSKNDAFPAKLADQVRQSGMKPQQVTLEITESVQPTDETKFLKVMAAACFEGFELAADDFGTGYSSLEKLATVPFTELKIDRCFIRNFSSSVKCKLIVEETLLLAKRLGLRTIAEGVEDVEVLTKLKEYGCNAAQGYALAKPMPAAEIGEWLDL